MQVQEQNNANIRLSFEAYAQFSGKLHTCRNNEELNKLLQKHLKYLFNYSALRISYLRSGMLTIHTIAQGECSLVSTIGEELPAIEGQLLRTGVPLQKDIEGEGTWHGWRFADEDGSYLFLLIRTEENQKLALVQSILRLMAESLIAKFLQFSLYEALDRQNEEIKDLLKDREEEILRKTEDLSRKNKELRQIVRFNAHQVREPLSRIIGLTELLKMQESSQDIEELPLLTEATRELDETLKQIIHNAEYQLKS